MQILYNLSSIERTDIVHDPMRQDRRGSAFVTVELFDGLFEWNITLDDRLEPTS